MSSPMAINRPASPAESSSSVSTRSSAHSQVYTRDELLVLAMSPLSQGSASPAIANFPVIMRKTRRGILEAHQTLDYERSASGNTSAPAPTPAHDRSAKPNATHRSSSPQTNLPSELPVPPPVWKVDVYVPPARRMEQEQRVRPGRDVRSSRTWRRPAPARVVQGQRW